MKKIFLFIPILILLAFSGCQKGLEPELYGSLNPTTFPTTPADYELYTLEVYIPFGCKWPYNEGNLWKFHFFGLEEGHVQLFDAPTDLFTVFTDWGDGGALWAAKSRGDFSSMVSNDRNRSHFEKTRSVTRMTKIIADLEDATVFTDATYKNQLIGEAKVARAWAMYYMLYLFGPVPVILDASLIGTEAEADMTRPSRTDYVNAMISDLRFAADHLAAEAPTYGRFNKGLALTVLMRLYLNEKDYANAETVGREIKGMGYALVDDYTSLFKETTERNTETIWAVSSDPLSQGRGPEGNFNAYSYYCRPWSFQGRNGWATVFTTTWDFYDTFDPADIRRTCLMSSYNDPDGILVERASMPGAIVNKYPPEGSNAFQGNDIVLARYADVLLMLAEAINNNSGSPTAEAVSLVNEVRTRAGIGNLSASDIADKQSFNDAILRERAWELFFEGQRKFDLVRMGKWPSALATVPDKTPSSSVLIPFPQYVLDESEGKITQNEGY